MRKPRLRDTAAMVPHRREGMIGLRSGCLRKAEEMARVEAEGGDDIRRVARDEVAARKRSSSMARSVAPMSPRLNISEQLRCAMPTFSHGSANASSASRRAMRCPARFSGVSHSAGQTNPVMWKWFGEMTMKPKRS